MMTDRELLEAAAKAAGLDYNQQWYAKDSGLLVWNAAAGQFESNDWNPLTDDGDAMRLAVQLRLSPKIEDWSDGEWAFVQSCPEEAEKIEADPCAATRRAIVRAAAAMASE